MPVWGDQPVERPAPGAVPRALGGVGVALARDEGRIHAIDAPDWRSPDCPPRPVGKQDAVERSVREAVNDFVTASHKLRSLERG